ncbi:MAG TPA: protein kinase [Vicinamibacterales bacterium]|nr:protein kinase [Vicinamibacterales bacterium]
MSFSAGQRLGPYELLSAIGAGGMGEVYRARDTRLGRTVAIKVLGAHLSDRPELRERFEREAHAVANLNHPHISVLYDIGREGDRDYLVIEYLEGETLAARLATGALPQKQALEIAGHIADALDAAHRQGITHRDLKPANIMLTKSGAKLLDFGVAKLNWAPDSGATAVPTLCEATGAGTLVGTVHYMAPEQLEGKPVDGRTDIYALGAVIHEMLTGKRAFDGIVPVAPFAVDRLVKRCLAKDPDDRWQSARDLAAELKWMAEGDGGNGSTVAEAPSRVRTIAVAAGSLAAGAALAAVAAWRLMTGPSIPQATQTTRMVITLPVGDTFPTDPILNGGELAIAPAGDQIVYAAQHGETTQLFVRAMDSLETRALAGTTGAINPVFSPDGQTIAFFADGKLKKIPTAGGAVTVITNGQGFTAPAWDGENIFFSDTPGGPLLQVAATGGEPRTIREAFGGGVSSPSFLGPGRAFAYSLASGPYGGGRIVVRTPDGTERTLATNATAPQYIQSGHLVYWRAGSLFAAPFDAASLQINGPEVLVVEDVAPGGFSVSRTGSLAYVTGAQGTLRRLLWVDRNGGRSPIDAPTRPYDAPQISPDGGRIAIEIGSQTWVYDMTRGALTRLAFEGTINDSPVWSPDGNRIAVRSDRAGTNRVFWQQADGSGGAEQLTDGNIGELPRSFSPDGQTLAYQEVSPGTRRNVWLLRLSDRTKQPFLRTPATEGAARFSPDGRWIAYVSDESGKPEVYVRSLPPTPGKWQVSTDGGTEPVWNRNGRELFFRSGDRVMTADVSTQPIFSSGRPRLLFQGKYLRSEFPLTGFAYDVSPDGQRFVMVEETGGTTAAQINVVLNWAEELKRRVPVKR